MRRPKSCSTIMPLVRARERRVQRRIGKTEGRDMDVFASWDCDTEAVAMFRESKWPDFARGFGRCRRGQLFEALLAEYYKAIGHRLLLALSHFWQKIMKRLTIGNRSCRNNAPPRPWGCVINGHEMAKACKMIVPQVYHTIYLYLPSVCGAVLCMRARGDRSPCAVYLEDSHAC